QRTVYEQMVNHGYTISQTSQVWLDHVVREQNGELICNWDAVEELFPPRVLDDMFCAYYDRLIQLANEGDAAWQSLRPIVLPAYQEHQLQQVNRTEAPVCEDLLQALFDKSVQARPGNVAVFNRGLQITYAELQVFASQIGRQLRDAGVQ